MQEKKNIHQNTEGERKGNDPFLVGENYAKNWRVNEKFILRGR